MKWLLLITLSLYSFIVQSAPCALTNVGEQRGTTWNIYTQATEYER